MINYFLWVIVITLIQLSLLSLWFDSELLSPIFQWFLKGKVNSKGIKWFFFSLITCPMCLGYWLSWGVTGVMCIFPFSPISNMSYYQIGILVFVTGLATSILSRIIDGFMPSPINQKLFILDMDKEEISENMEEKHD